MYSTIIFTKINPEPKNINIDSGIKLNYPAYVTDARAYTTLTDSYEITLIRRPPAYAPIVEKINDPVYINNFIGSNEAISLRVLKKSQTITTNINCSMVI